MKTLIILLFLFSGCYTGTLTKGYLVSIEEGNKTTNNVFLNEDAVENYIAGKTGFIFSVYNCIGEVKPYFSFENDRVYIYVERKFFKEQKINKK